MSVHPPLDQSEEFTRGFNAAIDQLVAQYKPRRSTSRLTKRQQGIVTREEALEALSSLDDYARLLVSEEIVRRAQSVLRRYVEAESA